jgi:ATP-dependent Lon protease
MPEDVKKEALKELARLSRMSPMAADYSLTRNYIEWLAVLPWAKSSGSKIDINKAKEILDEDHYELKKVKDRILDYLSVLELKPDMKGPILCFVGPPGVGKTSLGRSIARALGRKFQRVSLGGMHDEAEIRGHRRTYIGALPGQIIQSIRRAETNDPVLMLDEVDKLGRDFRGDPASALLETLDPEQNNTFRDNYLDVPFDLSKTLFICTANMLDTVPPPLLDRMELIFLQGYSEEEKKHIAFRYLIPRQIKENGITPEQIEFPEDAVRYIVRHYTREAGVRKLEQTLGTVCRKEARRVVEGNTEKLIVTREVVKEFLGGIQVRVDTEVAERVKRPGVAVGLAWTAAGGDILFIEANKMKGKGNFAMTGQIGEVMQESMQAALTWVRSNAASLGLAEDFTKEMDLHIHVPAGAIPKDGPSAGVTMATVLVSLLTDTPVRPLTAMTGEITLSGNVLPVGGIKEKFLAARRAGIQTIILPAENRQDVEEDLTPELIAGVTIHYASRIEDVLAVALPLLKARPDRAPVGSAVESDAGHRHQRQRAQGHGRRGGCGQALCPRAAASAGSDEPHAVCHRGARADAFHQQGERRSITAWASCAATGRPRSTTRSAWLPDASAGRMAARCWCWSPTATTPPATPPTARPSSRPCAMK